MKAAAWTATPHQFQLFSLRSSLQVGLFASPPLFSHTPPKSSPMQPVQQEREKNVYNKLVIVKQTLTSENSGTKGEKKSKKYRRNGGNKHFQLPASLLTVIEILFELQKKIIYNHQLNRTNGETVLGQK